MQFLIRHAVAFALLSASAPLCAAEPQIAQKLTVLSNTGRGEASYYLGMLHHLGMDGVTKDTRKAFELFKLSADRGDPLGAYKYGCYFDGQGEGVVKYDSKLALRYKLVAAEAGYALAQQDVAAHLFAAGDKLGSVKWLEKAAAQGSPTALMALGGPVCRNRPAGRALSDPRCRPRIRLFPDGCARGAGNDGCT